MPRCHLDLYCGFTPVLPFTHYLRRSAITARSKDGWPPPTDDQFRWPLISHIDRMIQCPSTVISHVYYPEQILADRA